MSPIVKHYINVTPPVVLIMLKTVFKEKNKGKNWFTLQGTICPH